MLTACAIKRCSINYVLFFMLTCDKVSSTSEQELFKFEVSSQVLKSWSRAELIMESEVTSEYNDFRSPHKL